MISPQNFRRDVPLKKLEDVVVFKDNLRKPITSNERIEGPYPYYGANGIQGYINDFIFDEELVLLAEDGGHFYEPDRGIAYKVNGKTWVNNHAHVLSPKSNIDINYLWRVLENLDIKEYVNGTTRAKLTKSNALQIKIPLPPLAEQKRIAAILDKANEIKAKRELALAKLDELAQITFIEMFGDPLENPMKWHFSKLKDITVFENGDRSSNYPSGDEVIDSGVLFLSTKNIINNKLNLNFSQYISELKFASLSRGKAVNNDLVITLRGTLGSCCIFDKGSAFINAQMMIIRCKKELVSQYLHSLLTSKSMHRHLQEIGNGAAVKQLTAAQLGDLLIPVPPIDIQSKFLEQLSAIYSLKEVALNSQNKSLRLISSLQNQAFTTGFNA